RYVNFALANEFGILGEYYGVDAHRIIQMVNQDYPRARIPLPGPAGGPCLSKDGYFLVEELTMPDFVLLAWKLNDTMPAHAVRRLVRGLSAEACRWPGPPWPFWDRRSSATATTCGSRRPRASPRSWPGREPWSEP